ncbi:hypothetical protein CR513_44736, partial [Mucuna pruriens]
EKNKVCILEKALYRLKQSPRVWFERFTQVIISLGYKQSQGDHTLFIKYSPNCKFTLLLMTDDMIIAGDEEIEKLALKEKLPTQFEMKELGKLKYFLVIEVAYSKQDIFISQRKYILDLLKETRKLGCQTSEVPIEQNHRIGCEESPTIEKSQYQRLVGKLIYLSHTRLDIAYVVNRPVFEDKSKKRTVFIKEGGNLVIWRSKKQNMVAQSIAKIEFQAMAHGICKEL